MVTTQKEICRHLLTKNKVCSPKMVKSTTDQMGEYGMRTIESKLRDKYNRNGEFEAPTELTRGPRATTKVLLQTQLVKR
jgi:hypothetical protein